ncbi:MULTISPECIES: serine hydrolase domain-containing protein [Marinomonas]|uniref:Beta-lactamase family protein n=1 Tax=Marinomonas rhodophyticola TaxID=2992803 RepID=A0ABT3KIS8_9GAMM|nr:serine hydrolase [Marinomonas sp. KJ51-3]MCW4630445.1 beta-lactamase family protein [Marinomonas sp. KJ51-3]
MTKIKTFRRLMNTGLLSLAVLPVIVHAGSVVDPLVAAVGPESHVPIAIQNLRWAMLDGGVNTLTFRSMDQLFTTRHVARSGAISPLMRDDHLLDFSYQFEGVSYQPEQFLDRTFTNGLLIMKDDKIVYENYRNNTNQDTRFMAWSMTKSLVSILVGIALEEGRIKSLDEDITLYLPELSKGAYKGVTIRQVLSMSSGVKYEERYDFANPGIAARNHILALVKNVARFVEPAKTIERLHEPGTVQEYKTIDTAVLGLLLERVSGGSNVSAYMAQHLWEPLGAQADGFFIMDGEPGVGREFTGAGYSATMRDFARVGSMMLNNGRINGKQIISPEWVKMSTEPFMKEDPKLGGYGYQWWTRPNTTAYSAIGLQGQYIYVDPDTRTVIVKLSYFPQAEMDIAEQETMAFFSAASAWNPKK